MKINISKDKIPKGMSYSLKSSEFEEALASLPIPIYVDLNQGLFKILFSAEFWPPNPNVQYERLYVCAAAIPSDATEVKERMKKVIVPEFIAWANEILSMPQASPIQR